MNFASVFKLAFGVTFAAASANAASLIYTCDSTVGTIDGSGVCAYLNSNVAALYTNTFSNLNANIYVTTTASGLGGSTQANQFVSYATYYAALTAESLQPGFDTTAYNSLTVGATIAGAEPTIFGRTNVELTAALAAGLGIPGLTAGMSPGAGGTDPVLSGCTLGVSPNCYNGVIEIVTPAGLAAETSPSQGLWFRDVAGTATGPQPGNDYDYFSVIEHETDELLGTASCDDVIAGPTANNECSSRGPSAVDLFRYTSSGVRVFNSLTSAYFSPDGGVTDTEGNTYNTTKSLEDYADFSQGCVFIQDAEGCLGQSVDITTDFLGGQGPEIPILNADGYLLQGPTVPEPGTMALLCAGLARFALYRRRA